MKYILVFAALLFFFLSTDTQASDNLGSYENPMCAVHELCPEYVYRFCSDTGYPDCHPEDCSRSTEIYYFQYCISIDCSKSLRPSVQNGWECVSEPECELKEDEYRTTNRDCVYCPSPGVFDNDVCNTCESPAFYSAANGQCIVNTCSEGYELPTPESTMCYPSCQDGFKMDIFGSCKKVAEETPECPVGHTIINGVCVKNPEPLECQTVVSSINCLKQSVTESLDQTTTSFSLLLNKISNLLGLTNEALDNIENDPNNNNSQQEQPIDTSVFHAEVPTSEIPEQILDQEKFSQNPQCPSVKSFTNWGVTYDFNFNKLCEILEKFSYFVMLMAFALSAYIVTRD